MPYLTSASHCPRRRDSSSDSPQGRTADRADTCLPGPRRRAEVLGGHPPQVLVSSHPQACAEMRGGGEGETCVNPGTCSRSSLLADSVCANLPTCYSFLELRNLHLQHSCSGHLRGIQSGEIFQLPHVGVPS